jgi:glutaredoxin
MQLTLYTRPGCQLCEEMKAVIRRVRGQVACELDEVDISLDEGLLQRYRHHIPVLLADGVEVARTRIGLADLVEALTSRRADATLAPGSRRSGEG